MVLAYTLICGYDKYHIVFGCSYGESVPCLFIRRYIFPAFPCIFTDVYATMVLLKEEAIRVLCQGNFMLSGMNRLQMLFCTYAVVLGCIWSANFICNRAFAS